MIRPTPITLLLTLCLPPAFFVALSASSMTPGMLVIAVLWCFVGLAVGSKPFMLQRSDSHRLALLFAVIAFLTAHVTYTQLQMGGVDFGRFFSSCAILLVLCVGARFAATKLLEMSSARLLGATKLLLVFLTVLGVAAKAGVPPIGPQASDKAIVIFSEPSHFGLAYVPILLYRCSVARRRTQFALIAVALALGTLLQSLTIIAGILVLSTLLLRRMPLILLLMAAAAGAFALDLTYYAQRLTLSADSDNLSALVYMQGWERAALNFVETRGVGVGFQQFGIVGPTGGFAERIIDILGDSINLLDGGSTASKLIGEFGLLGVVAVAAFVRMAIRGARYIRRAQLFQAPAQRDPKRLFLYSLVVSYTFELFVRGVGYFSPGGFLALAALIAIHDLDKQPATASDLLPHPGTTTVG